MICVKLFRSEQGARGFAVSGHAGYADAGQDIVCAAVTSAVQLTANAITEVLSVDAEVGQSEATITLSLSESQRNEKTDAFLQAFALHISLLAESYPQAISYSYLEV